MKGTLKFAGLVNRHRVRFVISPRMEFTSLDQIKLLEGDREIPLTAVPFLGKRAYSSYIEVGEELDLTKTYRLVIQNRGERIVSPGNIFDTPWFRKHYYYDGNDLGAVIRGNTTTFKLWAPTASRVMLNLFTAGDGGEACKQVEMAPESRGIWTSTQPCGHGTYYTYTVTTPLGTREGVDPYARAAGVNGDRGMVVDLSRTDPEGWENADLQCPITNYHQAVIWEVHVRDFSNGMKTARNPGKYLAFTESGLQNKWGQPVGLDYLKELGITHVHLMPVFDYATVDERFPDCRFNWGYDPKNYNLPEGSYATDPYHGAVRIREFKEMVQALHRAGIGVVMDMVYNHSCDGDSALNRMVPGYYYRYDRAGDNTSASGCGNDTASERSMFRKFMVDSAVYWVKEYKLDGLRFDLMGLHDLATMAAVEREVHAVNPNAILYGEGWTMGATLDGSDQANQHNIGRITPSGSAIGSIAVFNDVMRDSLKGSVFDGSAPGYINGSPEWNLDGVLFGMRGGISGREWSVPNAMVVNYMSAHDNHALWDKLTLSAPDRSEETRRRMNRLGAAIVMTARGTPFWQAGEEFLRTKQGVENSYCSSDKVNNLDWSVLRPGTPEWEMMTYYRGLICLRKTHSIFTSPTARILDTERLGHGAAAIYFADRRGKEALVLLNPTENDLTYTLNGQWDLVADSQRAGGDVLARETGAVTVEAIGARIYVRSNP